MNPAVKLNERLLYLDSARGLAAFSVMIQHFVVSFQLTQIAGNQVMPLHFFFYGEGAVLFFFVHSGFILSYSLNQRLNKTRISAYTRFIVERIFRIYPLFIFIVLLSYLLKQTIFPLGPSMYTTVHLQGFWSRHADAKELMDELLLIHSVAPEGTRRLVPQEWTSAVEIAVGCFIPLLAFCLKKLKRSWIYWSIILALIKIGGLNNFLFDFALGVYLFYRRDQIKKIWQKITPKMKWLLFGMAILLFTCFFRFASIFNQDRVLIRPGVDHVIVSLGCGLFFCILLGAPTLQKLLSHPRLVTLGRICYSLYLVHIMILICFADYTVQWLQRLSGLPVSVCILLFFIFYAASAFFISLLTFGLVEKPFNRWGKQIAGETEKLVIFLEAQLLKKLPGRTNIHKK